MVAIFVEEKQCRRPRDCQDAYELFSGLARRCQETVFLPLQSLPCSPGGVYPRVFLSCLLLGFPERSDSKSPNAIGPHIFLSLANF